MKIILVCFLAAAIWLILCSLLANSAQKRFLIPRDVLNQVAAAHWMAGCILVLVVILLSAVMR